MRFSYQRQVVAWVRLFAEAPLTGAAGYFKGEASMGIVAVNPTVAALLSQS